MASGAETENVRRISETYLKHENGRGGSTRPFHHVAQYLFAVGHYSECLDHIPATSPFVDYLLLGKRLEIKALYELQSNLFSYKLDAFKMFLSRTSQKLLTDTQRQTHMDFVNFLNQIIASIPGDQNRAERVIRRLKEKKHVNEWRWLLTKAQALKKR